MTHMYIQQPISQGIKVGKRPSTNKMPSWFPCSKLTVNVLVKVCINGLQVVSLSAGCQFAFPGLRSDTVWSKEFLIGLDQSGALEEEHQFSDLEEP